MQAHFISTSARLVVVGTAALILSACAHAPAQHYPDTYYDQRATYYDYRYYPDADYYYDTRTRVYIYYEHNHWVRARSLPRHFHTHSDRYIVVRAPHDRPYEERHRHRRYDQQDRRHKPYSRDDRRDWPVGTPRNMTPKPDRYEARRDLQQRDGDRRQMTREHNQAPVPEKRQKRREEHVQTDNRPAPRNQPRRPHTDSGQHEPAAAPAPPPEQSNQQPDRRAYKKHMPDENPGQDRPQGKNKYKNRADETAWNERQDAGRNFTRN